MLNAELSGGILYDFEKGRCSAFRFNKGSTCERLTTCTLPDVVFMARVYQDEPDVVLLSVIPRT